MKRSGFKQILDEINLFKGVGNAYLWHQHITGVELNPQQLLYTEVFEARPRVLLKGSRRIQKSFAVASHFLREAATKPRSEINIFSPAIEQSKRNIRYMTDMVSQSPILHRFLEKRAGGLGMGKEYIHFKNGSIIQAKGQATSVDGLGSTHIWLEEFDDMNLESVNTRILPTGSMIKKNYDYGLIRGSDGRGQCQVVVTGTIKGQGNLYLLENPPANTPAHLRYHVAPVFDCWDGVHLGIISRDFIEGQRGQMTIEAFARTYLCLYTESKNFFPTRVLNACKATEIDNVAYRFVPPHEGGRYRPWGEVVIGFDFAGQGTSEEASNTSCVVLDCISPNQYAVIYAEEWDPLANPKDIKDRVRLILQYFRPVRGLGDSYDTSLIWEFCKIAWELGLCKGLPKEEGGLDPAMYKQAEGADGWGAWYIMPRQYSLQNKHEMYMRTQRLAYDRGLLFPPVIEDDPSQRVQKLLDQMEGIVAEPTGNFEKFFPANAILGDDLVDALVGAVSVARGRGRPHVRAVGASAGPSTAGGFAVKEFASAPFFSQTFASNKSF